MYVRTYVCVLLLIIFVCMNMYVNTRMYLCIHVRTYVYICVYICMYVNICVLYGLLHVPLQCKHWKLCNNFSCHVTVICLFYI